MNIVSAEDVIAAALKRWPEADLMILDTNEKYTWCPGAGIGRAKPYWTLRVRRHVVELCFTSAPTLAELLEKVEGEL